LKELSGGKYLVLQEQMMANGGLKLIKNINYILKGKNIIGFIKNKD